MSGSDLRALNNVMVFPDPGGPHRTRGLCSASHVNSRDSCRTVSMVGMTTSGAATLCVSMSTTGTLLCQGVHSPDMDTCKQIQIQDRSYKFLHCGYFFSVLWVIITF